MSSPRPRTSVADELRHLEGVGAGLQDPLLGAPELRRRDELHRAGDLLRRLDGADPAPDVLEGRHRVGPCPSLRRGGLAPRAAVNSALAPAISSSSCGRSASDSSFFSRISARMAAPAAVGVLVEGLLERAERVHRHVVEMPLGAGVDAEDLALHGQRRVLRPASAARPSAGRATAAAWVALSSSEPNWANAASSRYWARSRRSLPATWRMAFTWAEPAHPRHRQADVHRRPDARVEEVGLEVDLAVGDRDDVGRDVGGHVAQLGLDDGQRGQRAPAQLVVQLRRPLEEPGVQVEDVARVRLAARRPAEEQRELAIRRARAWRGRRRCRGRGACCRGSTRPS